VTTFSAEHPAYMLPVAAVVAMRYTSDVLPFQMHQLMLNGYVVCIKNGTEHTSSFAAYTTPFGKV
jgi:hypothetical protein